MKKCVFSLIIFAVLLLQLTILDYFKIFGAKPDLLLASIIIASLFFESKWVIVFAVFAGILKDIFGINTLGINVVLFPLWGFIVIELSKRLSIENNFIYLGFIFVISILNSMMLRLIFMFMGRLVVPWFVFMRIIFFESLYTTLISSLLFKITKPVLLKYNT